MRSHWSNLDLNGATTHAWAFSLEQAASMRRSLLAEAATNQRVADLPPALTSTGAPAQVVR